MFFMSATQQSSAHLYQSLALREAIREYEANKWKAIGQKLGKPAKVGGAGTGFRTATNLVH